MNTTTVDCVTTSASVDWVTCTAKNDEGREALWTLGQRLLNAAKHVNQPPARWHGHGYSGFIGAGVRVGARVDSVLLSLSGSQSGNHWKEAVTASDNTSRIDLAVDTEFQPPKPVLARDVYVKMGRHQSPTGRKVRGTIWASSDGGQTLYVGARASENFGRLYDKGIEQQTGQRGFWWRWEAELKGVTARGAANRLLREPIEGNAIASSVSGWFGSRTGVMPGPFTSTVIYNEKSEPSDDDKRLKWLANHVRPTVLRLLDTCGRERVLFALGLSESRPVHAPQSSHSLR